MATSKHEIPIEALVRTYLQFEQEGDRPSWIDQFTANDMRRIKRYLTRADKRAAFESASARRERKREAQAIMAQHREVLNRIVGSLGVTK